MAVCAIGLLTAAGPASAVEFNNDAVLDPSQVHNLRPPADCNGKLCVFEDVGRRDATGVFIPTGRYGGYVTGTVDMNRYGPRINDQTSAIWNNSDLAWCVYTVSYYRGRALRIPPQSYTAWVGFDWNDTISSARVARGPRGLRC